MNEKAKAVIPNPTVKNSKINRLHLIGGLLTILGLALFAYFVYSVGLSEIIGGVKRIGISGFIAILAVYFGRILVRSIAWQLSVNEPYKLSVFDTMQAVIIGEALSSLIPLGILVSGTAKAVAVRRRVPFVIGLSSVATENLFYSLVTGIFITFGAFAFLRNFDLAEGWVLTIDLLIGLIIAITIFGVTVIIRQWHLVSAICQKLYEKGILAKTLEKFRFQVREFENQIFGFYRRYPQRFLPIFLMQVIFHALGVFEVWYILSKISNTPPTIYTAFLLESISRVITVVFKLIPFVIGVDEAGARFVTQTLALGGGIGVTLAIIRKGRILFWTAIGILMILKREFSVADIFHQHKELNRENDPALLHKSE